MTNNIGLGAPTGKQHNASRKRRKRGKPKVQPKKVRRVIVCRVKCRCCATMSKPLPLTGALYLCERCGASLFGYDGPTIGELHEMQHLMVKANPTRHDLERLEEIATRMGAQPGDRNLSPAPSADEG